MDSLAVPSNRCLALPTMRNNSHSEPNDLGNLHFSTPQEYPKMVRSVRNLHTQNSPLLLGEVEVTAVAEALQRFYSDPQHW